MDRMDAATLGVREIADLFGPPGLPFLGNALQIKPTRMHLILEGWRRLYGDPYRFSITGRTFLVVADAEAIGAILRDRPDGFRRTDRLESASREMGFGGVFSSNGERWRRQRPMVMAGFDPARIKAYFPTLRNVPARFAGRWRRAAQSGREIDLQADLMRYTVDVTAGLAFGADINTIESDEDVIQRHLDKILPSLGRRLLAPFPYWRWFRLPRDRRLAPHVAALHEAVDGFIAQARRRLEADPALRAAPKNLIEAMLVARDSPSSGLDDSDVSGNVLTMLLAGEDTTANTLAWMIYLLSRHPEALARARDEVRGLLADRSGETPHPLPSQEHLQQMPYIEACINETMRLKPVAPIIIVQANRDTTVAGVRVPKDNLVLCLMRPPATDERHFKKPEVFEPARWLDAASAGAAAAPSSAKRVAMPFGAGPRLCPGRYLAIHEMKMAMAMLLGGFDIESVTTPDAGEAREVLNFTMAPGGLKLRLRLRE